MNAGLYGGFRLVLLPRFEPAAVLEAFAREQVGFWVGVPTMYWALLQHVRTAGVDVQPARRLAAVCVVRRRADAAGRAAARSSARSAFASSRATACRRRRRSSPSTSCSGRSKPGTVGLPIFGVEVRCVDEHDRPVAGRRARRSRRSRPERHEGLLQPPRRDRGGDARRLVPHRRHRRSSTPTAIWRSSIARRT